MITLDPPTSHIQSDNHASTTTPTSIAMNTTLPAEYDGVTVGLRSWDIERSGSEIVAIDQRTGMYGEGVTESEAARSLAESLRDLRDTLRDHPGALAPELAEDLEYLNHLDL